MSDDTFHEIQLNGKQLVFLFMVAVVVSSVIFLCGVLVGRGVRNERDLAAEAQQLQESPTPDAETASPAAPVAPAGADPTTAPPPATVNDAAFAENLGAPAAPPAPQQPEPVAPKPVPSAMKAASSPATAPRPGFGVQVAALKDRSEAERIVKRLAGKGYPAYVIDPAEGTPVYRVRVGNFKTRSEANTVAARLEKEERVVKPWVTQ
jgi:cell division septation protein DedD